MRPRIKTPCRKRKPRNVSSCPRVADSQELRERRSFSPSDADPKIGQVTTVEHSDYMRGSAVDARDLDVGRSVFEQRPVGLHKPRNLLPASVLSFLPTSKTLAS